MSACTGNVFIGMKFWWKYGLLDKITIWACATCRALKIDYITCSININAVYADNDPGKLMISFLPRIVWGACIVYCLFLVCNSLRMFWTQFSWIKYGYFVFCIFKRFCIFSCFCSTCMICCLSLLPLGICLLSQYRCICSPGPGTGRMSCRCSLPLL